MKILERFPIRPKHSKTPLQEPETVGYDLGLPAGVDAPSDEKLTPQKPTSEKPTSEFDLPSALLIETPGPAHEPSSEPKPAPAPRQTRLVSLDAFRGLTVVLMLIVNNIALDRFTPDTFVHGGWNQGLSLADYVFPWFLLCVGLSIPFSFASFAKKGLPSWRHDVRIWSRFALLMGLGCLVNCAYERRLFFSLGVLQLIAMAYLIAAYTYELPKVRKAIIGIVMLVGYGMAIRFLPTPGAPIGSFTEDANFIGHINKTYLMMYNIDGLFSVIPTAALVIFGSLIGDALLAKKLSHAGKIGVMTLTGIVMSGLGMFWNLSVPYNKPVWTPSYILLTGGVGILVLALLYLLSDAVDAKQWSLPLRVFGSNALLAYTVPVLIKLTILSVWTVETPHGKMPVLQAMVDWFVERMGRIGGGWTYTGLYIACVWLVLFYFYRRRTYLRV